MKFSFNQLKGKGQKHLRYKILEEMWFIFVLKNWQFVSNSC